MEHFCVTSTQYFSEGSINICGGNQKMMIDFSKTLKMIIKAEHNFKTHWTLRN